MITNRQLQILLELIKKENEFIKSAYFAKELNVSSKTIQNDIKILKLELKESGASILAETSKGYFLNITNKDAFSKYKTDITNLKNNTFDFSEQLVRVSYILKTLLTENSYVKAERLADEMYICQSRITVDLQLVRKILKKYDLEIIQKPNYGIKISGLEKDKRLCIVKEKVPIYELNSIMTRKNNDNTLLLEISDIVSEILVDAHYKISDIIFQNLLLHIFVAIKRVSNNEYIGSVHEFDEFESFGHEIIIAKKIMKQLSQKYNFQLNDSEIKYLALNLQGKRNYENSEMISEQTNNFVTNILAEIKVKMGLDLTYDVQLRISLALHIIPLILRIKHNMQLKNVMLDEIKQNFTLAYDVATHAASYITELYKIKLTEDEIGYLAAHFNLALQNQTLQENPKRILIICSSRRGDTLLMKHNLLKWFKEMISQIDMINLIELGNVDLKQYDVIFTTFLNNDKIPRNAIKVNYFLDENDYCRIEHALTGEPFGNELLKYFSEDLMIVSEENKEKEDIINEMCTLAKKKYHLNDELYDSVIRREELGFTSFGNMIALPHPDTLITKETFVVVSILNKPITWGSEKVRIVLLISVEKGNKRELKSLFEGISGLIKDKDSVENILKLPTYENFMSVLKKIFS